MTADFLVLRTIHVLFRTSLSLKVLGFMVQRSKVHMFRLSSEKIHNPRKIKVQSSKYVQDPRLEILTLLQEISIIYDGKNDDDDDFNEDRCALTLFGGDFGWGGGNAFCCCQSQGSGYPGDDNHDDGENNHDHENNDDDVENNDHYHIIMMIAY